MIIFWINYSNAIAYPITTLIISAFGNDRIKLYDLASKLGYEDPWFAETQIHTLLLSGRYSQLLKSLLIEHLPVREDKIELAFAQTDDLLSQQSMGQPSPSGQAEFKPFVSACNNPWRMSGNWLSVMGFRRRYRTKFYVDQTLTRKCLQCQVNVEIPNQISQFLDSESGKAMVKLYDRPIGWAYYPRQGQAINFNRFGKLTLWDLKPYPGSTR